MNDDESSPSQRDDSVTRRAALRAAGATVVAGTLAGCGAFDSDTTTGRAPGTTTTRTTDSTTPAAGAETERDPTETGIPSGLADASDYETVVNVAAAGADTSGETPIDSILNDREGDDTLFYFPPGRYRLTEWRATGYRNLGVVGDDAVLVPPDDKQNYWLMWGELSDFLFAGMTVDCRAEGASPITYLSVDGGTNRVRNVAVRGLRRAPNTAFEIAAADPNAALTFENVALPDGSTNGHAIFVFPESVGRLTFRNCRAEHWTEGVYAAYHSGPLRFVGGYYANNGIEQVRVGGGTAGALVRDVTVRVDNPRHPGNKPNMRGIWAEEGGHVRIENCDIAVTDLTGTYSSGGIVVGQQFGEAVVENTRIRTDTKSHAISVREPIDSMAGENMPSMERLPDRTRFRARDVRISGSARSGTAVRASRRDDCEFERVCIQHPRGSRDGMVFDGTDDSAVRNATIDVGGDAIRTENATVETTDVRTDGSC